MRLNRQLEPRDLKYGAAVECKKTCKRYYIGRCSMVTKHIRYNLMTVLTHNRQVMFRRVPEYILLRGYQKPLPKFTLDDLKAVTHITATGYKVYRIYGNGIYLCSEQILKRVPAKMDSIVKSTASGI